MDRLDLETLIKNYQSDNKEENDFKIRMLDLLATQERCFDRSCMPPGHFTGSCLILGGNGERTLMTHHRALNRWLQLGGHADGNPDLLDVALREGEEESGITPMIPLLDDIFNIDIHFIPANPKKNEDGHWHYDVQFLLYAPHDDFTISPESHTLEWLTYDEATALAPDPGLARLLDKWHMLQQTGHLPELIAQAR